MHHSSLDAPSRAAFLAQHRQLDALCDRVLEVFEAGDRAGVTTIWTEFERAITRHMDGEERRIFPSFRLVDPEAVERLLVEHSQFRRRLAELGVATDLHLARLEEVRDLVKRLRIHLSDEKAMSYRAAVSS